ncbi:MAG: sel1 repeat family protein [Myxococcales bacterium]|nr:sel1 repeat family protein [Myxococcales bacterium]
MTSARGATTAAIVSGVVVGTLAALCSGPPAPGPAPTRSDVTPVMTGGPAPTPERVAAGRPPAGPPVASPVPVPTPSPSPTPTASAPGVAPDEGDELDRVPVVELEKRCAFRQPASCSAAARAFEAGRGIRADAAKARLYRSLALSLLDERCVARDAQACLDLSLLHERGLGVKPSPEAAGALRRRALELCVGKTSPFCGQLGASLGDFK